MRSQVQRRAGAGPEALAPQKRAAGAIPGGRVQKRREPTPYEKVKLLVAEDLGLGEKVREVGWAGLTAAETGRIGGLINRRLRQMGLVLGPGGTLQPLQLR